MNLAVAVGCSRYEDSDIADLKYAHVDADRFAERLVAVAGVGADTMLTLHDGVRPPTRSNVLKTLIALPEMVSEPVDTLYFFFSGHGFHSTVDGRDYLLTADSIGAALEETSLSFELVLRRLNDVRARHVLLFLDACRAVVSGGKSVAQTVPRVENLSPPGMVSFCSCEPQTVSYESDELGSGVFTRAVLDALSESGQCVTVEDLDVYLRGAVPALSRRHGKPRQLAHTRVEPLSVKDLQIVTAAVRNSWQTDGQIGQELRPSLAPRPISLVQTDPLAAVDLGTSYSAIALSGPGGELRLIPGPDGRSLVPSVVSFTPTMDYRVGTPATEMELHDPAMTVRNVKRLIGTDKLVRVGDRSLSPELVASLILRALKDYASRATGVEIRWCVASYPANFGIKQVNALERAFILAGFDILRMIGEPNVAALLALQARPDLEGNYLIVDLGGGTFDVAVAEIDEGVCEVLSVAGSNELGGLDYDEAILGVVQRKLVEQRPGLVLGDLVLSELRREAERAKRLLGSREQASVVLRDLETSRGFEDIELVLTRDDVRAAVRHLDNEVYRVLTAAIEDWHRSFGRSDDSIDVVLLTGQGSKMFTVREPIAAVAVGAEVIDQFQELAVTRGLNFQANVMTGLAKDALLLDLTNRGIGIRVQNASTPVDRRDPRYRKIAQKVDETVVIVDRLTFFPLHRSGILRFVGDADEPLDLLLVERSKNADEDVEIGRIRIPLPSTDAEVEIGIDIDPNGVMLCVVRDLARRVQRVYQLNKFYKDRTPSDSWQTDGWTTYPVRKLAQGDITDDTRRDASMPN